MRSCSRGVKMFVFKNWIDRFPWSSWIFGETMYNIEHNTLSTETKCGSIWQCFAICTSYQCPLKQSLCSCSVADPNLANIGFLLHKTMTSPYSLTILWLRGLPRSYFMFNHSAFRVSEAGSLRSRTTSCRKTRWPLEKKMELD